ncbi:IS66 family transposase [Sphingomonas sp. YL-JM2C]
MNREDLERLTKSELIDLVLGLQRPDKTSQTSSKPPSTDRKETREHSRPGGAKPGHKGHARALAETPDAIEDHRPTHCLHCGSSFAQDAPGVVVGEYDEIDLPAIRPVVRRHRRLSCRCGGCGKTSAALVPAAAQGTPFGRRIHALALYLKANQLFSYERLQGAFADLFGLKLSQGALMNMFKRTAPAFAAGRDEALAALRTADVVACDETGARIEGCNAWHWVFCSPHAVVHTTAFSRAAQVVRDTMEGHQPEVWISDRYSAQQGHGRLQQTCLAHLDRKARYVAEHGSDLIGMRLQFWFDRAFSLARDIATLAASTVKSRQRALMRDLDAILTSTTHCPLACDLLGQIRRARDQMLTFCGFAGKVDATNNISERALRPSVIQRKVTNGYRAKWAADAEAALRSTVDTARLAGTQPFHAILRALHS